MLTSIGIKNFRRFDDFQMENLGRINLIGGKNNVGKTSLLEALFLLLNGGSAQHGLMLNARRLKQNVKITIKPDGEFPWESFFYGFDTKKNIQLFSTDTDLEEIAVNISSDRNGFQISATKVGDEYELATGTNVSAASSTSVVSGEFETQQYVVNLERKKNGEVIDNRKFVTGLKADGKFTFQLITEKYKNALMLPGPNAQDLPALYSKVIQGKREANILESLKEIDPKIKGLSIVVEGKEPILMVDIGLEKLMPVHYLGDGILRLMGILVWMEQVKDGVLLIDEIENGIHYSFHKYVWQTIYHMAEKMNIQVFATTHSFECIEAANEAVGGRDIDFFKYHRIEDVKGKIKCYTLDKETMETALEMRLEVR